MAPITVRALIAFLPRNIAANDLQANIDTRLLLFAFLVSLAIGFLAGAAPALQACRESLVSSLRERGRHSLWRLIAAPDNCYGSNCVYVDSSHRGRLVCSHPLRAFGKGSGV